MAQCRMSRLLAIAFVLAGVGACATMTPPATNSGPAQSSNGVQMAVVRQLCAESQPFGALSDWIDETVELQVRNGSPEPVNVHPDRFRLVSSLGGSYRADPGRATEPLTIGKGETQILDLTFAGRGGYDGLDCTQAMRLDPRGAIAVRQSPVALPAVSFVPVAATASPARVAVH
jgi:hypothetical protein